MQINSSDLKILLCGQLITSRTETLEDYLKNRFRILGVIGITSPFAKINVSRCTLYDGRAIIRQFSFPSFLVSDARWYKQPLLVLSFGLYFVNIIFSALRLKKKFDIFIGVACFSAFTGLFLKKLGITRKLAYYCIDYYPTPKKFSLNTISVILFRLMDRVVVRNADITWHISKRIEDARFKYAGVSPDKYYHTNAPLTYSKSLLRFKPLEEIERYTIGFVGSISENQGLQLLVKALPEIIARVPKVRVRVIGRGPYSGVLNNIVAEAGLKERFIFHGFIKDEAEVLEILSSCALGIAPWTCASDDNIIYADPGKPKLYAFCGIPIIMTNGTPVAEEIETYRAGISINYNESELRDAAIKLLADEGMLREYKVNAGKFAHRYITETIFDSVLEETIKV
ncbi:MAG: glycosyltransferase [Candidatus Omnitrophota bacterium]|jgi:glycosyltransferase involved in cell wall biosynthesis|nr:MAG: glycosyltransferase [Candidatus Omnitrophota bacterium]